MHVGFRCGQVQGKGNAVALKIATPALAEGA
jgi:hypothetical protein